MSEDIRVLLVKLADRLHNMRTLRFIKDDEKRRRIARETMDIYAPLAERIGMQEMKDELEDLAFAELYPDARASIIAPARLPARARAATSSPRIIAELTETLKRGRARGRGLGPREVALFDLAQDAAQERRASSSSPTSWRSASLVDDVGDCYHALGIIHAAYHVVPGRFKDYISTPKPNDYRSLHTGVIGPERQRIEVQIRTREMHEVAELGVAAHWPYKQGAPQTDGPQYRWLRELLDILDHASGPEEFLEHTKLEMFQDQVFCFTPKGDLIALPRGATPVDFAYAVHSADRRHLRRRQDQRPPGAAAHASCRTATRSRSSPRRRRRRRRPGSALSSPARRAPASAASSARSSARNISISARAILQKAFRQDGQEFSEKAARGGAEDLQLRRPSRISTSRSAQGLATGREVVHAAFPQQPEAKSQGRPAATGRGARAKRNDIAVPIRGLIPGMALHFAGCCHPLPGDRIVGIVTTGKGVTIHTIDCETLESFAETPERWLDVAWSSDEARRRSMSAASTSRSPTSPAVSAA